MLGARVVPWNPFPIKEKTMALSEPVLSGPGAGRTVTHGGGTSSELKLAGEQSGGDWAVVEWRGGGGGAGEARKGGGGGATSRQSIPTPARMRPSMSSRARSLPTSVTRRS